MINKLLSNNLNDSVSYDDFFAAFGYTDKDEIFFRTFKDKGEKESRNLSVHYRFLNGILDTLRNLNKENRGIFFVVNGGGQDDKSVKIARAQFMEIDPSKEDLERVEKGEVTLEELLSAQLEKILAFSLPPSILIITRKSIHCYWLIVNGKIDRFKEIQERLIQYFDSDKSIKNPSRVMRLYGFLHQKKDPVMVRLIKFNPELKYTQQQFHEVLPLLEKKPTPAASTPSLIGSITSTPDWMQTFERDTSAERVRKNLEKWKVPILGESVNSAGSLFLFVPCFNEAEHTEDTGPTASAIIISMSGVISYVCKHGHCSDLTWNDFKKHYQDKEGPATEAPKEPEKVRTTTEKGIVKAKKKPPKLVSISGYDLAKKKLPPIYYAVDGLIPEGLTILAAPPKSGKSWMVLDMCLKVAAGEDFLGFKTHTSDVLYLALEDGDNFEQERLSIQVPDSEQLPKNFHFVFNDVVPVDEGFIDQIEELASNFENPKLFVIDTLKFVKGTKSKQEGTYDFEYRIANTIKKWAESRHAAAVIVTHTTQLVHPDDALANVNGTNGLVGAADSVLVIAKEKRTAVDAVLAIDGRRVRQAEHSIRMNWNTCRWEYIGVADPEQREREKRERELQEIRESSTFEALKAIADHYTDGWKGTATQFIKEAAELRVFVLEESKNVGKILSKYVALFATEAGIRVQIIQNGNAPNIYRITLWSRLEKSEYAGNSEVIELVSK